MLYFFKIELIFFKLINSLPELYEEKHSTATMNSVAVVQKKIMELMDAESRQIEDGIDAAVESIQNTVTVWHLPQELLSIMNMWIRTNWYHTDRVPKFEHCLRTIVSQEVAGRVFHLLMKEVSPGRVGQMVDDEDLRHVVNRVSRDMACGRWQDMETDLVDEAKHWVSVHGEHVTAGDGGHFQWYDSVNEVVCYHLPHIPKEEHNEERVVMSLETLPSDFNHEADWTCPICLELDAPVPTCVRTECKHIFHKSCLEDYNRVFLAQEENCDKVCCCCPMCRAVIN